MRLAMLLFAAVLAIAALGYLTDRGETRAAVAIADLERAWGPTDYGAVLESADRRVDAKRERLAGAADQWLHQEVLASALFERFRLAGDGADLDEARSLLDTAMKSAPAPSGPTLTRAAVALADHDLAATAKALDRFERTAPRRSAVDRSEAIAIRGDIAFQQGDVRKAGDLYAEADALSPAPGTRLRIANASLWTGDAAGARDMAEAMLEANPMGPLGFARMALLMANFSYAQGDIERAGEWIAAAQDRFDGFWLADAYAAQNRAAEGDFGSAIAQLTAIAEATGEPEVMDTLSGILLHRGETEAAARWTSRSERAWREKLDASRSAYRLHAAEHYLDFGDPGVAVALAREEVAARPFGEAIEVLASALTETGEPAAALKWLERADAAGWRAVSLDLARWEALNALGRKDEAAEFLARAKRTNPLAGTEERKLVRFGHF
jgi:tetratricopeptide (TPR) repeat protein